MQTRWCRDPEQASSVRLAPQLHQHWHYPSALIGPGLGTRQPKATPIALRPLKWATSGSPQLSPWPCPLGRDPNKGWVLGSPPHSSASWPLWGLPMWPPTLRTWECKKLGFPELSWGCTWLTSRTTAQNAARLCKSHVEHRLWAGSWEIPHV